MAAIDGSRRIGGAGTGVVPLVVGEEAAEELRDDELRSSRQRAAVQAGVILRIMGDA